jgi:7,8-dihydropterin-6-yl-methyl-4-(beta-D-ribofuranosyl)aminobenzene 5'-phosphate synthase
MAGRANAEHGFHVIASLDKLHTNGIVRPRNTERQMTSIVGRREFLAGSAALTGAAMGSGFACVEFASAAPVEVPVIEKLSIRVLVDSTHNLFLRPATVNGVSVQPTPILTGFPNVIHTQWGPSTPMMRILFDEHVWRVAVVQHQRSGLVASLRFKPQRQKVDALIVSHGHFDHYGGLTGFLEK